MIPSPHHIFPVPAIWLPTIPLIDARKDERARIGRYEAPFANLVPYVIARISLEKQIATIRNGTVMKIVIRMTRATTVRPFSGSFKLNDESRGTRGTPMELESRVITFARVKATVNEPRSPKPGPSAKSEFTQ